MSLDNLPDMISVRSELEHFGNFRLCGHSDNRKHLMIKRIKVTVTVLEAIKAVHQTVQVDACDKDAFTRTAFKKVFARKLIHAAL